MNTEQIPKQLNPDADSVAWRRRLQFSVRRAIGSVAEKSGGVKTVKGRGGGKWGQVQLIEPKNQTIAINTQTLPDGSTRRLGCANSSAGLTTEQADKMLQLGIEPVKPAPRSTDNHAEDNIIDYTEKNDPDAVSDSWGISKGAKQGSQPCERCAPKVQAFGGTIQQ